MKRINFQNLPNTTSPINDTNMNLLQDNIEDVFNGSDVAGNMVVDSVRSKNLFTRNNFVGSLGNRGIFQLTETGIRAITTTTDSNQWGYFKLSNELMGKTCTFSCNITVSSTNEPSIRIYYGNENDKFLTNAGFDLAGTGNKQITNTFLSSFPTNCNGIYVLVYANRTGTGFSAGAYADYNNLQLEEGSTKTSYSPYQDLNPDVSGLDNGHMKDTAPYGGLAKRNVRANTTTYTIYDPNYQNSGYIRNAMVMCGDSGIMFIRWSGNNAISPTITWSSLTGGKTCTITHSNGVLIFTFSATVYGGINVLFMN